MFELGTFIFVDAANQDIYLFLNRRLLRVIDSYLIRN